MFKANPRRLDLLSLPVFGGVVQAPGWLHRNCQIRAFLDPALVVLYSLAQWEFVCVAHANVFFRGGGFSLLDCPIALNI